MSTAIVFDIQRMCMHDGPGMRTTVFFKGCSLRCFWCHNPESLNPSSEILYMKNKCITCQTCLEVCPQKAHGIENGVHIFNRDLCIFCGKCAENCNAKALIVSGVKMSANAVLEELLKDKKYYDKSKGGVTFSGGEPLLQSDFLLEILKLCKGKGIHTAIETAGNVPWDNFKLVEEYVDLFLYDIKIIDEEIHKKAIGASNKICLSNFEKLAKLNKNIIARVPIIPNINDNKNAISEIYSFVQNISHSIEIELLPFHNIGKSKYESLEKEYVAANLPIPQKTQIDELRSLLV